MPIEANILLAQSALSGEAGVSALGMGWQVRPPEPVPWALVLVISASRDLIGGEHSAKVTLEAVGGSGVGETQIEFEEAEFTPAGLVDADLSQPVMTSFSLNLPPLHLEAGTEFHFRLWVDGETRDHWIVPFRTTPP
jgi:hypothetical protein